MASVRAHERPAGTTAGPARAQVTAPAHWQIVDFISDLHLHAADPQTFEAWQSYLQQTSAQAVFILGDLFDVWVGDDAAGPVAGEPSATDSFELRCARVLRHASTRIDIHFLCGNRDFLVGAQFLANCGVLWLKDPCVLELSGQRWLLSHGDALCLDDTAYQQFRHVVRSPGWQADFLQKPLAQRLDIARGLRERSERHKKEHPEPAHVDAGAAAASLRQVGAHTLIHGHTHQPADHVLEDGLRQVVLSDWDLMADPPRAQVLRLGLDRASGQVRQHRLALGASR